MGFGPPGAGFVFEEIFDGSVDVPVSFPWEFESPLPFTVTVVCYFSPIIKNEIDELICYVIDRGANFYKYNITRKRWTKLASPTYRTDGNYTNYRSLALSPDGSMLACNSESGRRLEIYTIATDTWVATAQAPDLIGAQTSYICSVVWETNDKLWCWAKRASVDRGQCLSYIISTTTWWASGATETGVLASFQGRGAAFNPSGGVAGIVYGGAIGASGIQCCKYDINGDSYAYISATAGVNFAFAADRDRVWYYATADYRQGYIKVSDDSNNDDIFPENTERAGGNNCQGFNSTVGCIWYCRTTSPKNMSYIGTGMWSLISKTWITFVMVIIDKPDDGFAVTAIEATLKRNIPFYNYDTILVPAGTWKFYYPKDGAYADVVLFAAPVE